MNEIEISLPPLKSSATAVERSSFTLLRRDGDSVERGEPIAFCTLVVYPRSDFTVSVPYFDQIEHYVVILAPGAGRISWNSDISEGGWRDWLAVGSNIRWNDSVPLGRMTVSEAEQGSLLPEDRRIILCSGRRMVPTSDVRGGLLPGWYERVRAWNPHDISTVLVIATTCQLRPAIVGDYRSFHELLTQSVRPLHVTYLPETLLIPTARTMLEGLWRDEHGREQISSLVQSWFGDLRGSDRALSAAHLAFLLATVGGPSPLEEPPVVLQLDGVKRLTGGPCVLLSVDSETADTYQHQTLPFSLSFPKYIYTDCGSDFKRILDEQFYLQKEQAPEELAQTYRQLSKALAHRGGRLLITNTITLERGSPLFLPGTLHNISKASSHRARVLNDMLYQLEDEGVLSVVDIDTLSASIGVKHIPDGAHGNGVFVRAVQELIARSIAL